MRHCELALVGGSVTYLLLHECVYALVRWTAFGSEWNILLHHVISSVWFCTGLLFFGRTCNELSVLAVGWGMIFMRGIYSGSFLELWSLAQGSYSISILLRVMQEGSAAKSQLEQALSSIGQQKKQNLLAALSDLHLIRRENEIMTLCVRGASFLGASHS